VSVLAAGTSPNATSCLYSCCTPCVARDVFGGITALCLRLRFADPMLSLPRRQDALPSRTQQSCADFLRRFSGFNLLCALLKCRLVLLLVPRRVPSSYFPTTRRTIVEASRTIPVQMVWIGCNRRLQFRRQWVYFREGHLLLHAGNGYNTLFSGKLLSAEHISKEMPIRHWHFRAKARTMRPFGGLRTRFAV